MKRHIGIALLLLTISTFGQGMPPDNHSTPVVTCPEWQYDDESVVQNEDFASLGNQGSYTTWGYPVTATVQKPFRYKGYYYPLGGGGTSAAYTGVHWSGQVVGCNGYTVNAGDSHPGVKEYIDMNALAQALGATYVQPVSGVLGWKDGYQIKVYHRDIGSSIAGHMDPPVVICQGFDPDYGSSGGFDMAHMEKQIGLDFIKKVLATNRSVVLVKFEHPNDDINNNASAMFNALQLVKKQAPNQDMVLIGPSMGGLIMRSALLLLPEAQGQSPVSRTPVKMFIAYDSPNWGAVIPMSVQAAVQYFATGGVTSATNTQAVLWSNLSSTAASQMLLYKVPQRSGSQSRNASLTLNGYFWDPVKNNYTTTTSSQFLLKLNRNWLQIRENLGAVDGTPIKLYAVTDGSPDQDQGLGEGVKYASGKYTNSGLLYTVTVYNYQLQTSTPGVVTNVAHLDVLNKNSWNVNFSEPVVTENVPGSIRDSYNALWKGLNGTFPGTWNANFLDSYDPNHVNIVSTMRGHAFIPTISAACLFVRDLREFNQKSTWYLYAGTTTLGPYATMFDKAFINQYNQGHILEESTSPAKQTLFDLITGAIN